LDKSPLHKILSPISAARLLGGGALSMRLGVVGTPISFCPIVKVNLIFVCTNYDNNTVKDRFPLLLWLPFSIWIGRSKSFGRHGEKII
jgi:hypothetical protein